MQPVAVNRKMVPMIQILMLLGRSRNEESSAGRSRTPRLVDGRSKRPELLPCATRLTDMRLVHLVCVASVLASVATAWPKPGSRASSTQRVGAGRVVYVKCSKDRACKASPIPKKVSNPHSGTAVKGRIDHQKSLTASKWQQWQVRRRARADRTLGLLRPSNGTSRLRATSCLQHHSEDVLRDCLRLRGAGAVFRDGVGATCWPATPRLATSCPRRHIGGRCSTHVQRGSDESAPSAASRSSFSAVYALLLTPTHCPQSTPQRGYACDFGPPSHPHFLLGVLITVLGVAILVGSRRFFAYFKTNEDFHRGDHPLTSSSSDAPAAYHA